MRRVDVRGRKRLLDDFFKVDALELSWERGDGTMSPPLRRLVFERGDAVAAVVRHRESRALLFTEQFRAPVLGKGDPWLVELVAGMIDAGETPEVALARELAEELGFAIAHVEPIATFFVSPGGTSERIWLYYAEVSDAGRLGDGGGVQAEHEDIRVLWLPEADARAALAAGRFADAKTIIGLQWLFARGAAAGASAGGKR